MVESGFEEEKIEVFYKVESCKTLLKKQILTGIMPTNIGSIDLSSETREPVTTKFGLNPKYVFENFVVGKGNELANAACQAVAANPGKTYNPLFIYGGVGLGKTHLMQGLGHAIIDARPDTKVLYVTSETFTNEYIQAVKEGKGHVFKDKYRNVDVLLVDDIQFISGKEGTQEAFFHTFNELHQQNRQIVISSDRPPKAIQALEARLLSRFEWGMIADIMNPDYETRVAILEAKCKDRNYNMDPEIISYIANTIVNNVRELEGGLNKIIAYHHLNNTQPTPESVKNILSTISASMHKQALTAKTIISIISEFYDITTAEILGSSREKRLVIPRQISMYLMREELKSSFPSIGQEIGGRDHTTAMHAYDKIKKVLKKDDKIRQNIEILKQKLYM